MVMLAEKRKTRRSAKPSNTDLRARQALERHVHFRGRSDGFTFDCRGDVLIVRGRVPSFYLKQVLENVLKQIDGVRRVDNQVDVVCCDGLSSVRRSQKGERSQAVWNGNCNAT
jgi:hypothetical protein